MASPEVQAEVDLERAERFYTRLRRRITRWFDQRGSLGGPIAKVVLVVPDFFALVLRLLRDPRINGQTKLELAAVTAYVISLIDLAFLTSFCPSALRTTPSPLHWYLAASPN